MAFIILKICLENLEVIHILIRHLCSMWAVFIFLPYSLQQHNLAFIFFYEITIVIRWNGEIVVSWHNGIIHRKKTPKYYQTTTYVNPFTDIMMNKIDQKTKHIKLRKGKHNLERQKSEYDNFLEGGAVDRRAAWGNFLGCQKWSICLSELWLHIVLN